MTENEALPEMSLLRKTIKQRRDFLGDGIRVESQTLLNTKTHLPCRRPRGTCFSL